MKWNLVSRVIELRQRGLLFISFLLPWLLAVLPLAAAALQSPPPTSPSGATSNRDSSCLEYRLPPGRYEKAVAFARAENGLYFISIGWGILSILLLLQLGIVAKLRDFAEGVGRSRVLQSLIFIPCLILILAVAHLPISIYGQRLVLQYELSVQGWGSWIWDWTKRELLTIAVGFLVIWILFGVIGWKPRTWWLYFWIAIVPVAFFLFFISPWVFDPLFNTFEPLERNHPELVQSIGKLTERAGVPIRPGSMFLMEASAKTNEINAYVTGFGASKRVVVWDTTIEKAPPEEVLYIVGHELGHYVLGHVWKGFLFFVLGMFLGLYSAHRLFEGMVSRWGRNWGVRGQEDWAALAVLLLIMQVLEFLGTPLENGFRRIQEHEADVYGLEVTHGLFPGSNKVAAHAFQVLGEVDLADPNPSKFITFWLYSHPPIGDRLSFACSYDPWTRGQSPQFVK
ncbi:MAG TPA: M48 family metallopeptidase [Candidatus Acidoferrum sp.]|nr:M48 family metallopeptidase [Candidatus Acidoferrum sp.]